jgi:uncharacterized phage-like protein YoqJ
MILGITGHRPHPYLGGYNIPNPTYEKVYQALQDKFHELCPEKIISGMALGTDQWAAWAAMELSIPFIAAVPFEGQDSKWPDESKRKFKVLLDSAAEVVIVSPGGYALEKMHIRDRWIVDNSNALCAVWTGIRQGGTFGTIRYAENEINKGREYKIHFINPSELT